MYYGILAGGRVHDMECDPREIDDKCEELDGVLITQAETIELYRERRAKDPNGKATWV